MVQLEELVTSEAELVDRDGRLGRAPEGDHAGEVAERPPRAHGESGPTGVSRQAPGMPAHLLGHRAEEGAEAVPQPAPVTARGGVVAHELGREAGDAEGKARRPVQGGAVAHHDLKAAPTEVEPERGPSLDDHAGPDGPVDEPGLLLAVDHPGPDPGLGLDGLDQTTGIGRLPEGTGGAGDDPGRSGTLGQGAEAAEGLDRSPLPVGGDPALPGDVVSEAQHLLLAHQRDEGAVGSPVHDEQVEGARPQVDGRDPHVPRR